MLIGGRVMTVDEPTEGEPEAGPCSTQTQTDVTPKLDHRYFDKMCYAPPKKTGKSRIELCKTLLPVPESPMSPLITKEGRVWTPPYAARHGRFSRLLPCAKHKARQDCQRKTIFWMHGLWQIFRGNQEREGGVVCCYI